VRRKTWDEKICDKIDVRGEDECWPWIGYTNKGYGVLKVRYGPRSEGRQKHYLAHRCVWALDNGVDPDKLNPDELIIHDCSNYICCNPSHLFSGDHQDKADVMVHNNRTTSGSRNGRALLRPSDVRRIRLERRKGRTLKSLSEEYKVHLATIDLAARGVSWAKSVKTTPLESNNHRRPPRKL